MKTFTVHAAKTHLSRLIEQAERGEDIVISRRSTPVVRLVPVDAKPSGRRFGAMKGQARVGRAFFEPLPQSELDGWDR